MSTYSKLLLSTGGGIISQIQQAEQVEHTATLLIGLGGTGIDCLTEVKKAVRERLQPDVPEALVPTYNHIRFLAVDTDLTSGITGFDQNETFDISNPSIKTALKSKAGISSRGELDWLDPDKINIADIGDAGAGGFRQAGRYMMMDKSNAFLTKIKDMIVQAKQDAGKASLYVHIFAGISGGTGSGTFLDACYLVRKAIMEVNGGDGIILGYFFLPDVNLSKIPSTAALVHTYVPKNGYAAMQELDYCMRLPENGGSFTQKYKNGTQIDWNEAPVDLCHLISATDKNHQVVNNAYNNAMKVTAEYVMDFLTKPDLGTQAENPGEASAQATEADTQFTIKSHLANFTGMVNAGDGLKNHGYNLRYLVIGASCASIPMRKINTYLTSKVFEAFEDLKKHVPTETEVAAIADKIKLSNVDSLLNEITRDGGDSGLTPVSDAYGMEFTRDNGDKELVYHYTNQKAEKAGAIERNAKSMMDAKNVNSLLGRICAELDACATDYTRGPAYAYKVVQASMAGNLINIIDGMIENVEKRRSQREYNVREQPDNYCQLYEEARNIWYAQQNKRRKVANNAFDQYVYAFERKVSGEIEVLQLEQLLIVLKEVKKQIIAKADTYYQKFSRVMSNLMETFHENYLTFGTDAEDDEAGLFAIPLIKISEIRSTLDQTVEDLDMPSVLSSFVTYMFTTGQDGKTCWEDEDENKITKAVKAFFINNIFGGFANKSITSFLYDKYGTNNPAEVSAKLYNEYMLQLKNKSEALFPVDASIYGGDDNAIAYVSVPSTADVIINAAQTLHSQFPEFSIKKSALRDRIYIMRCSCALPIGAYANGELYETNYYGDKQEGRHYYIGQGGSELFNNWHDLLPLRPDSLIEDRNLPDRLRSLLNDARQVYEDAKAANLFQDSMIMKVSDASVGQLEAAMTRITAAEVQAQSNPMIEETVLTEAMNNLKAQLAAVVFEPSGYKLPEGNVSTNEIRDRIHKDYFVISPALHTVVKREMEKLQKYKEKCEELENRIAQLNSGTKDLKDFAKALFVGAVEWDKMFKVSYNKIEYGIPTPAVLTDMMQQNQYKYAMLPLYQAYLSYKEIDQASKDAIANDANQKFAGMAALPAVVANIKACEQAISPAFLQGQMAMTATFPEIAEDAKKFLGTLSQELAATVQMVKAFGLY